MILVLGGDSWADRSSFLGVLDMLQCQELEQSLGPVTALDLDEKKWYKELKKLMKRVRLLVVCGGRPVALSKCLGNNGRIIIQQWLATDPKNKYLGICAGVAFAKLVGVNCINLINDEAWRGCGLSGEVQLSAAVLSSTADPSHGLLQTQLEYHYENGPLISYIDAQPPLFAMTYAADIVAQRIKQLEQIEGSVGTTIDRKTQWLCHACTYINSTSTGKCGFCSESRNYCLPPVGQMPGSIAIVVPTSGQFLLSSVHPELSDSEVKAHFIELLLLFAAQKYSQTS